MRIILSVILFFVFIANLRAKDEIIWPDAVYKEASELASKGEYAKAEAAYQKFLTDFSKSELIPYVKYDLAICYFMQKKVGEAIKELEELSKLNSDMKVMIYTALGECYIDQKDYDKAMASYERGNKAIAGGSPELYVAIANLQFIQKDNSKAKETIKYLINRFPGHEMLDNAELLLARILVDEKDPAGANKIFESKIADMRKNPLIANIIYQIADQLVAAKSYEHAIIFFNKVPGKDITLAAIQKQIDEVSKKVKGIEKTRAPGMEKAIGLLKKKETDLKKALENAKAGKDPSFLSKLKIGQCFVELKKFEEARKSFNEILTLDPKGDLVKDASYAIAVSYLLEGKIKKEEKSLFTGWSLFYQGNAYYNLSEFDKANASYQRIIDEYPQEEYYKNTLYQIGFSYGKKGAYVKAVEYLKLFVQKYPKDEMSPNVFSSIGDIYMADQKYKEAYDIYERALEDYPKSPASPRIRTQMGDLYYKQGKYKDMSKMYEILLKDYPDSPYCAEAYYWIGWSLITDGKKEQGYKNFDEAKKWNDTEIGRKIQFKIAEYNFSEKEFEKAKKDYEDLVDKVNDYAIVDTSLDRLAEIYARQKALDEGIARFTKFAEKKKNNNTLLGKIKMAMIDLYFRQKKVEQALKLWGEVSNSIPKEYFSARNYYIVASNLESIDRGKEAFTLYNEAISRYTDDGVLPYIYARIAYHQLDSGKKASDVYEFLKKPMVKFKDMNSLPEISLVLAEVNFDKGNMEEAIKYYKKSINKARGKTAAESTYKLASSYFKLNKYKEALTQYAKVAFVYAAYKDIAEEALFKAGRGAEFLEQKDDAKKYYEALIQRYPNGKYKKDAEFKIKN